MALDGDNNHDCEKYTNFDIGVDEEKDTDVLIDGIEEHRAKDHAQPTADVDGRDDDFEFGESLEISDVHLLVVVQ